MYKNKIGRYILAIGSNEEATRLSGIATENYKIIAYVISGLFAGIAAVFWSASFVTVAAATGNGMELDAIAGVYIGGTSAAGGVASIGGSVIGAIMLVVIRSGLNFVLALFNVNVNATYVTYVLTGVIVVAAILFDVIKKKKTKT
jgi:ribose transport system permease protein